MNLAQIRSFSEETINNFIPQAFDNNELPEVLMKMDIVGDEYS